MIVFAVHLHQRNLRVRADLGEDAAQDVDRLCVEHTRQFFARKTKCTCNLKTQWRPRRILLS
jgi:hypothetical protein